MTTLTIMRLGVALVPTVSVALLLAAENDKSGVVPGEIETGISAPAPAPSSASGAPPPGGLPTPSAGRASSDTDPIGNPATGSSASSPRGIWISREEIERLPDSGSAWYHLRTIADRHEGEPDVRDQEQKDNVYTLAKALAWAKTGWEPYRTEVRRTCLAAVDTELDGRTLALGRNLAGYVIAADIVGLEPDEDAVFRDWLRRALTEEIGGRTLRSTHEDRPNNWGTHAGASRLAVAAYLGDRAELERAALVFRGWLGDRTSYAGFQWGALTWHADETRPVGINPPGSVKRGEDVSGALPDDMRRGGDCRFPPVPTGYAWEALQGAVVQAEILHRAGFPAWEWKDRALLRAVEFLRELDRRFPGDGWWAHGDDEWIVWLVNARYGTDFPTELPARTGKNMGWTDWTHAAPNTP